MAIIKSEIESIHGDAHRLVFYRCQDDGGVWHSYGPVITTDRNFDAEAYKLAVAAKVSGRLAEAEAQKQVNSNG